MVAGVITTTCTQRPTGISIRYHSLIMVSDVIADYYYLKTSTSPENIQVLPDY